MKKSTVTIKPSEQQLQYKSSPDPPPESSSSKILIFVLIAIVFIISLLALFAFSYVGNNQSNANDDIDKLQKDVNSLTVISSDLVKSTNILENKTTDLTYSNDNSTFSKNLIVGQTLTVGGKNISSILDSFESDSTDVLLKKNLIVDGLIYAENKNVNSTLSQITNTDTSTNFSKNVSIAGTLTVSGKDINKIISGVTVTDTEINLSKNLTVNGEIASEDIICINAEMNNLIISEDLIVNDKNISSILDSLDTTSSDLIVNKNLILNESLYVDDKNVGQTISQINTTETSTNFSKNISLNYQGYNSLSEIPNESKLTFCAGTGNGSSYETFNNAIYSEGSIGFVNSSSECKTIIDPDNGIIKSYLFNSPENIICNNSMCGYIIQSDEIGEITLIVPVIMSVKKINPPNIDDYWVVNPGFKIIIYAGYNYTNRYHTLDNSLGQTTMYVKFNQSEFPQVRQCRSIKVSYNNKEISPFPDISD